MTDIPKRRITLEPHVKLGALPGRNDVERTRVLERLLLAWTRIGSDPVHGCDLDSLSTLTTYSVAHLQRSFTRVFGMSPHQAAVAARMRLAGDLLRETGLAIGDIAARVGYADRAAFARAYRRYFGEAPHVTRAAGRADAAAARLLESQIPAEPSA